MKQKLIKIKGEIYKPITILGNFNTLLSVISGREKLVSKIEDLNDTINQLDLIYNYRILHSAAAEYTLVSRIQETFTKIDNNVDHKTKHNTFRITESYKIFSMFTNHKMIKVEMNTKRYLEKPQIAEN